MKTFIPLFIVATLLFSCSSPEKKAQRAIKEDLRLTLHDFKSYEPVQYGKLEIANSSWDDLPEVKSYLDSADDALAKTKEYSEKADIYNFDYSSSEYMEYNKMSSDYLNRAHYYMGKTDSIKLHFIPQVIGWKMTHSFRAKNLGGNFKLGQYEFYFDKGITKVIKSVDLSEE